MSGLIVDLFAGGGGASTAIFNATGRHPDVAINHDPNAIAIHTANHPTTRHFLSDIHEVDPVEACTVDGKLQPIDLMWVSPDCTHFSKARGGKPVEKGIRSLADVVLVWIDTLSAHNAHPRLIALENVEEFQDWGPVLENGKPCPDQKGLDFRRWTNGIKSRGYTLEWREMVAADYGAPTTRKRLKLIARRDGEPIIFPEQTHAPRDRAYLAGKLPWRSAAECIDWSIPVPSIFGRKKALAPKTMRRIARGIDRFVIRAPKPFIVPVCHTASGDRVHDGDAPMPTITRAKGGELAVAAPTLLPLTHAGDNRVYGPEDPVRTVSAAHRGELALSASHITKFRTGSVGTDMADPIHTITANGFEKRPGGAAPFGAVSAFLKPRYGERDGQDPRALDIEQPHPTVVPTGNGADIAATFLQKMSENGVGVPVEEPLHTAMAQAPRHYQVAAFMARQFGSTVSGRPAGEPAPTVMSDGQGGKLGVGAAFLHKYYETGGAHDVDLPIDTVTAKARFGLDAAFIEQANTDMVGHSPERPLSTIVGKGCTQRLIDLQLDAIGAPPGSRRRQVLEFLWQHFGEPTEQDWAQPLATATARLRFGLVLIEGEVWQIADVGMRMLVPRELFNAQGFPPTYIIEVTVEGRPITKTAQTSSAGNSVSPPPAEALLRANLTWMNLPERVAA